MPEYKPNKDGYYKKTLTVGIKPNGEPSQIAIRSKSLTEFKRLLKEAEARRDRGYDFETQDMTVSEWAKKWMEVYKKPKISQHQYSNYEINLRLHVLPVIGHVKMTSVKPVDLQEILNAQEGKSRSNTDKIRFAIQQLFRKAYRNGIIIKDVSEDLEMPETIEGERRPLTDAEKEIVLKVAQTNRAGLWVLSMYYAGLRPEETVPLMWSDIDLTPGAESITVQRAVEWDKENPVIKALKGKEKKKGKEKERTIPIPSVLSDKLRAEPRKGLYVFTPQNSDGMLKKTQLRRLWLTFRRDADIAAGAKLYRNKILVHAFDQTIAPYNLRHTYCTSLFEIGVDLKKAQYLMGHADIKTTANIYTHFTGKSLEDVGNLIRKKLGGGQTLDKKQESNLPNG